MKRLILISLMTVSPLLACGDKDDDTGGGGDGPDSGSTGDGGASWDTGCVTSDDAPQDSFATVSDAIEASNGGATISLSDCSGPWTEAITIDKDVTVDFGGLTLEEAIAITGDNAGLQNVTIDTNAEAVTVTGATGVQIADLTVPSPKNFAVMVEGGAAVVARLSTTDGDGGAAVIDGSLTLQAASIVDGSGYGVYAENSDLTITASAVTGIGSSGPGAGDGLAVVLVDSTLTSSDSSYEAVLYTVYAEGGAVTLDGDTVTGGQFGVLVSDGALTATEVQVGGASVCGVYGYATGTKVLDLSGITVVGEEGEVVEPTIEEWYEGAYQSTGMFLIGDDITLRDSSVDGFAGAGVVAAANTSGAIILDQLTLTNQANHGLYVAADDVTLSDIVIRDTRSAQDLSSEAERCFTVDSDTAAVIVASNVDWSGGEISGSAGYGVSSLNSDVVLDDVTFQGNRCAGLMNFGGDATVTGSVFEDAYGGALSAAAVTYDVGTMSISGSTFQNSQTERLYDSQDLGTIRYDYYSPQGTDVQVYYGSNAVLSGNTHSTGSYAFEVYSDTLEGDSSLEVRDSTLTDYAGFIAYVSDGSTVDLDGLSVDGFGGYGVYCAGDAEVSLKDVTLENGQGLSSRYEIWQDGSVLGGESFIEYVESVYLYGCDVEIDGLEIATNQGPGALFADTTAEIDGLDISSVGQVEGDALAVYAASGATTLLVQGGSITDSGGVGLSGTVYSSATANVNMIGTSFAGAGDDGISLQNLGFSPAAASFSFDGVGISGSAGHGLWADTVDLRLNNTTLVDNDGDGLHLVGGQATLTATSAVANGGYGIGCEESPVISSCDIELLENTTGSNDSCGSPCPADEGDGGGDTGGSDTGA
ncbi:MAG: right-handed parallel beta-helix repeat-containing protein [Alphaproteobacteria bacterium]|nr:right-handed parallel beta-helix repeat-containing protein [Alphaproteobacteria bacterium]